jgi:nitrate reductase beta subunit
MGGDGSGPFGEASGRVVPIAVENMRMLRARQTADSVAAPEDPGGRVNLLNWDGKGRPTGLFPPKPDSGPDPAGPDPAGPDPAGPEASAPAGGRDA